MVLTMPEMAVSAQSLEDVSQSSASVLADGETKTVSCLDEDGQPQTVEALPLPKQGTGVNLAAGWYIAEGTDFDKYTSYSVNKDVKLILADGCRIELVNGISVSQFMGGKLSIYAQSEDPDTMGELNINTTTGAAIGNSSTAGDITINGGKIVAVSSDTYAAAIGSGKKRSGGNITINGGYETFMDIGVGSAASGADICITGGTIRDSQGEAQMSNPPTCDGNTPVYATMADLSGVYGASAPVTDAEIENYGFSDVYTDERGNIYIYLPQGETTAHFQGVEYTGTITGGALNELKKTGLTLQVEVSAVTPTTAELSITATPGSTVFYVESKTPLTEPEEVFAAADVQQITVEDTGAGTLSLKDLEQGTTYYYYFASQLGSKTSQVVAVEVCPAALSLENAEVILTGEDFIYNGASQQPKIRVLLDGKELIPNTDYTVSFQHSNGTLNDTTHAGTVTITITGTGLYGGTAAVQPTYVISQKPVTAQVKGSTSRPYDGTVEIADARRLYAVAEGILEGDVVSVKPDFYCYETPDVGQNKTILAQDVELSGKDAANYLLTGAVQGNVGEVTKSVPGFELQHYGERVYNGEAMPFPDAGQLTVTRETDLSLGTGEVSLSGDLSGEIEADSGTGEIELYLRQPRDAYVLSGRVSPTGSIQVDGAPFSGSDAAAEGKHSLRVGGGTAEISLWFDSEGPEA